MIQSYACIEEWRRLLEEEIPRELGLYQARLAAGTAHAAWHAQAAQQCGAWKRRLAEIAASPHCAAFEGRYALWTAAAVQSVVTSLDAIAAAVGTPNAAAVLAEHLQ